MTTPNKRLKLDLNLEPILSDDLTEETPLIEVYTATIRDPKTISKIVIELNSKSPIPELMHLKRIKKKEVLLTLAKPDMSEIHVIELLKNRDFDITYLEEHLKKVRVAKIPPKVRKQYEIVNKLWPCNFHSNPYLEKLTTNTLFTQDDLKDHANFMNIALEICKITGLNSGTVVVDPLMNSVVAFGYDNTRNYPIQHSVMVAIDNVAKTQGGGVWNKCSRVEDAIVQGVERKFPHTQIGFSTSIDGPYLCTDYVVYTTHEPCITCAMALVHSRVKRVFYGIKTKRGGLGSLCKIHTVPNLNHHFEAFSGLLEEKCTKIPQSSPSQIAL